MLPTYLLQKGEKEAKTNTQKQEWFPILYAKTKTGGVKWYQIEVQHFKSHSLIIRTHASKIGGKAQQDTVEVTSGVNIGKVNETTVKEQAFLEAESRFKKQRDKGYKTAGELGLVIEEDGSYHFDKSLEPVHNTDAKGALKPMLASEGDHLIEFPCTVQPKLDGHRGMIKCISKGVIEMTSRSGKSAYNKRIHDYLAKKLKPGEVIDGEFYCHGKSLQEIAGMTRSQVNEHADAGQLLFIVFDVPDEKLIWSQRKDKMFLLDLPDFSINKTTNPVVRLQTLHCPTQGVLEKYHAEFLRQGFEGTIIRNYRGKYEFGFRSRDLIKKKVFDECEFTIVDVHKASGRNEGCAIFECVTVEGKHFRPNPVGTIEERKDMYKNRKNLIGKMLTVQYRGFTEEGKGVPFQPIGIRVREDI